MPWCRDIVRSFFGGPQQKTPPPAPFRYRLFVAGVFTAPPDFGLGLGVVVHGGRDPWRDPRTLDVGLGLDDDRCDKWRAGQPHRRIRRGVGGTTSGRGARGPA